MPRVYTLRPAHAKPGRIDFQAELNPQQYAAVTAPPGPALVIAGAGSGKTRTLIYRVAYLLENGVPPAGILLLTFTNKAAREMLERVTALMPDEIGGLWGGTFHSIGNRLLRRHAAEIGYAPGFSILDREDQKDLLDSVVVSAGIDTKEKRFPKGEVLADVFSFAVNTEQSVESVLLEKYPYFLPLLPEILGIQKKYESRKVAANSMDFDDLLEKALRLLERNPGIAERYQRQFQFILVDEYQDTNKIQSDFIDILAAHHGNVMVVGDDAQSIYSWRGANFQNILEFPKRYPQARDYKIETNYRSLPEILAVANAAIAGNLQQFKKELQAFREAAGVRPALVPLGDSTQQARFVAQRILELREGGLDLNEIAVLYRAHYHSMEVQMELTRHGIPFQITSGLRFFEQAHIKDVAAFLKFAVNPRDEVAFKRMVRLLPGVGARSAENLWSQAGAALSEGKPHSMRELLAACTVGARSRKAWEQLVHTLDEMAPGAEPRPPLEMIQTVMEAMYNDYMRAKFANFEARREDLNTLGNFSRQYNDANEFLDQLALLSGLEAETELGTQETETEMVNLTSVHQAKGLEWKAVFIIWLTDGMFPSSRSLESDKAIEEERRLFYVAITRARDELYLSYPALRLNAGYGEALQRPSRFLQEIPAGLLEEWQIAGAAF